MTFAITYISMQAKEKRKFPIDSCTHRYKVRKHSIISTALIASLRTTKIAIWLVTMEVKVEKRLFLNRSFYTVFLNIWKMFTCGKNELTAITIIKVKSEWNMMVATLILLELNHRIVHKTFHKQVAAIRAFYLHKISMTQIGETIFINRSAAVKKPVVRAFIDIHPQTGLWQEEWNSSAWKVSRVTELNKFDLIIKYGANLWVHSEPNSQPPDQPD